jgi:hypothetical protein
MMRVTFSGDIYFLFPPPSTSQLTGKFYYDLAGSGIEIIYDVNYISVHRLLTVGFERDVIRCSKTVHSYERLKTTSWATW